MPVENTMKGVSRNPSSKRIFPLSIKWLSEGTGFLPLFGFKEKDAIHAFGKGLKDDTERHRILYSQALSLRMG